jgi:hypothetical protein
LISWSAITPASMRVTDHKTGKFDGSPGQIIVGGTSLQPLLYALAAAKLFAGGRSLLRTPLLLHIDRPLVW